MARVQYEMATRIDINTVGAVESIKYLTAGVNAATSAWKAQEAMNKSVGDSLGAVQAKFNGLGEAMDKQKDKIEALKAKQASLDTETEKGRLEYEKTQIQIDKATTKLSSMTAQQERAKASMQYQESGLAALQRGYQTTMNATDAYVGRLKAEGKQYEADKAQLSGYKTALDNLNQQYSKQASELDSNKTKVNELKSTYENQQTILKRMKDAGMENSDSYKHQSDESDKLKNALNRANDAFSQQKIRLDKTATAIAENKTKTSELDDSLKKVDGTPFEKLKLKVQEANEAGEKNSSVFKDVLKANLATKAISFGWQEITMHIGGALAAGMEYDKEQQKMVATWQTLTGSVNKAHGMVDTVNQLSVATGQSAEQVDELEQGFYHLNSNKKESDAMTHAMLNMSDAVGLSGQQIQAVTQDMVNGLSRGKANAGMLNQISQYFPMFREQLAEYETKLQKTGDTATKTGQASTKEVAAQNKKMVNLFESMHYGSKNSLEDLQKYQQQGIISGTQFQTFSDQLSKGQKVSNAEIKQAIRVNANYAASAAKGAEGVSKSSKVTVSDLNEMAKQGKISAKDIENVFEELGNKKYDKAADNMLSTMVGAERVIKARVPALIGDIEKPLMEAKNPIFLAVSKWVADPKTDKEFTKVGKATTKGLSTITAAFTKAFDPKSMGSGMDKMMDKLADSITKISNSIAKHSKDITEFFKNFKSSSVDTIKLFVGVMTDLAMVTIPLLGFMAKNSKVFAPLIASMIVLKNVMGPLMMFSKIAGGLKETSAAIAGIAKSEKLATAAGVAFNAITSPWFILPALAAALVVAGVQLYNHWKPFRDLINGLGKMIVNVFKGVIDFFKNNWKQIGLIIINPFIGIPAMLYKNVKPFRDFVNSAFSIIKTGFGAIGSFIGGFWNGTVKLFSSGIKLVTNVWSAGWNFVKNIVVGIFNGITSFFGGAWNIIKSIFSVGLNFVFKLWESEWNGMKNIGVTIWNFITGFIGGFWNGIKSIWNGSLNWISKVWSDSWEDIFKFGKWIWDMISGTIGGFWNGIKSVFNSSLNWVSDVWNKGWTAIFDFGKGIWNGISSFVGGFWGGLKSIFKTAGDDISGIWNSTWQGVSDMFGSVWKGIKKIAQDGVNGLIDVLNAGIDGIDWVVNKFGGPKEAIGKVKPVKFATGTGAIQQHTYSMLNDGNDSPETGNKEMAILPNGKTFMPQEKNWTGILPAGTEVLNAKETKMLMSMQGISHFAEGTGIWDKIVDTTKSVAGDVWGEIKDFGKDLQQGFDIATKIVSDPSKYLNDKFKSPELKGDLMNSLGKGMFDKTKDAAGTFWNEIWSAVGDILGSGGGSGSMGEFLSYAQKNFSGRSYELGGFDCSEMIREALAHFGINAGRDTVSQEHSGKLQSLGGDINKSKPGDLVYFGTSGADAHVGIVSDIKRGLMFNQHPPRGGVSPISEAAKIDGAPRFYHVKGLSSDDDQDKSKKKSDSGVSKLVHSMFDNSMFKWIKDNLASFGDSVDSGGVAGEAPKGDHKNWLKQAGIPESESSMYDYIVSHESGWNPHAKNPNGGAYGLPQSLPGSKMASAGSDWKDNPITQLKWMKSYVKDRYGGIKGAYDYWHVHHNYENGGLINHEQMARVGEGNKPEMVIPLDVSKRSRANELLHQVLALFAGDFNFPSNSDHGDSKIKSELEETKSQLESLNKKFDNLLTVMENILSTNKEQVKAQYDTAFDSNSMYRKQALDQNIVDRPAW